ncbi:MAG: nitrogen fixation protein NifZ [Hydrogenophilus sp.]|nr:nitrogen fixation protein NifZ [Hydrogenophilus sp.]
MKPLYDWGDAVRVIRNIRNDGTYPGLPTGALLIRRGSVGHIRDIGTFLQDQIIYAVHFLTEDRIVGCREEELIPADAPWTPSRFEVRERVRATHHLAVNGHIVAPLGTIGEILKVDRDHPAGVHYHVYFPGHTLLVPEHLLEPLSSEPVHPSSLR